MKKLLVLVLSILFIKGCGVTIEPQQYKEQTPKFDLESFFDGNVTAWGIVQDRSGNLVQRFIVDIDGSVQNGEITLDETFIYSLGSGPEKRVWTLTKNADGSYKGAADDITGQAIGTSHGNAFNFIYEMDLEVGDASYRVQFDDWFWAMDEQTMMNRSYIKKFGLVMAEVTIFMQRQED